MVYGMLGCHRGFGTTRAISFFKAPGAYLLVVRCCTLLVTAEVLPLQLKASCCPAPAPAPAPASAPAPAPASTPHSTATLEPRATVYTTCWRLRHVGGSAGNKQIFYQFTLR